MSKARTPGSRSRILTTAADLFLSRGYADTSLSQIAEGVGLSKASVLYHFSSKDQILMELAEPLLAACEQVLETADATAPDSARWVVVEGLLDASFDHLRILTVAGAAGAVRDPVYQRMIAINQRAVVHIAGSGAGLREQIRASAVLTLLARPVVFHQHEPRDAVRREVLDAAHLLLDRES
ncbi:TetR/AcrR family transcriptional regulator [Kitasatospora viridis]|uniref:TetR family transcriptional regulator n=1 Tax=Kitasatospora viridis TaxID=281105 RepID=A0A561UM87_9ACTN|nr:TetR/AcrR family transcriptional regulator [Kitasatospora viridis]TWG00481.1 TetR family transcriptional regulator [Kitasatospora viridis]